MHTWNLPSRSCLTLCVVFLAGAGCRSDQVTNPDLEQRGRIELKGRVRSAELRDAPAGWEQVAVGDPIRLFIDFPVSTSDDAHPICRNGPTATVQCGVRSWGNVLDRLATLDGNTGDDLLLRTALDEELVIQLRLVDQQAPFNMLNGSPDLCSLDRVRFDRLSRGTGDMGSRTGQRFHVGFDIESARRTR